LVGKPLKDVDYTFDFFSATTFLTKYSNRVSDSPIELPSCMYERVSIYLAEDDDFKNILLDELNNKRINFATPIYTNAGIDKRNGMISCNLTTLYDDSIEGINETLNKASQASKEGAGIGLLADSLRSKHSIVSSFNQKAGGVVRFADMVQSHMRFYKQGSRSGSCAIYLSVWHRDIRDFLELTLPIGDEKLRARDLFTAVVINDLFMEKLMNNEDWYLFCPNDIKKSGLKPLQDTWGDEFVELYNKAVELGIGHKVTAKSIWDAIIKAQVESGRPYVFFKDNANKRYMHSNIGVCSMSNLCAEIINASKPGYTAQCTLGSLNLSEHSDLDTIAKSTAVMVRALNAVIDKNKWSDEWSENAGLDQRSLAIGVAGLADFFAKKKISFESEEAKTWTDKIFETMYKSAVEESVRLSKEQNRVYPAWGGSPYSKGETYIDGWSPLPKGEPIPILNSFLLGLMPTASSSILLGVFESFEPVTSNIFTRRVGQGEFLVINKYLVDDLIKLNLWNDEIRGKIISNSGSVQSINEIPQDIKDLYKDVWEIPQKVLLDLAGIRNKYVDQSQSLNVYHSEAKYTKISSALMYAWKIGLKTGSYYTRTKSKIDPNSKLSSFNNNENINKPDKTENSQFECFGCSA
jgi:ribonucleoside-diphosphate reductase alpha subunit